MKIYKAPYKDYWEIIGKLSGMASNFFEYSRREIGTDPFTKRSHEYIPSGKSLGISDQYLVLDSFLKLRESNMKYGEFKWNLAIQGATQEELIGVPDRLSDVIEMEIEPFYLPILEDVEYETGTGHDGVFNLYSSLGAAPKLADYMYPPNIGGGASVMPWQLNPYSQLPYSGLFTIQIKELGRQGFSDVRGNFHQFECRGIKEVDYSATPGALYSEPICKKYIFTDPIRSIDTISIVIRNPDVPLKFLPDVLYDATFSLEEILIPSLTAPTGKYLKITYINHGLKNGDRVFINGAKSSNSLLNSHLNRPDGHVIVGSFSGENMYGLNTPNSNVFFLDPLINCDFESNFKADIMVAKRRIRIPIRMRRNVPYLTNSIKN